MKKIFFLCIIVCILSISCMEDESVPPAQGKELELFQAIEAGDFAQVEKLITQLEEECADEHSIALMARMYNGKPQQLFNFAFCKGNIQIIDLLCDTLLSPQEQEFFKAVQQGDIEAIKRLVIKERSLLNTCKRNGNTALIITVQKNYMDIARELLCLGANISHSNACNQTALTLAINQKNAGMVTTLLRNAFDFDIDKRDKDDNTPFMLAVKTENRDIIKAILAEVPDYFIRNKEDKTALQLAEVISDETIRNEIKKLLESAQSQFNLHKAITLQDKTDVEQYITPDISLNLTSIQRNPLITAIKTGNIDIVKLLVNKGACVNQVLHHKITPLMGAVIQRTPTIVEFFLKEGADPNAYTEIYGGVTPIFIALGHSAIMKLLVENKADINYQISHNIPGQANNITPLMATVVEQINYSSFDIVQALLALRANPLLKNSEGQTALDIARDKLEISTFWKGQYKKIVTTLEKTITDQAMHSDIQILPKN